MINETAKTADLPLMVGMGETILDEEQTPRRLYASLWLLQWIKKVTGEISEELFDEAEALKEEDEIKNADKIYELSYKSRELITLWEYICDKINAITKEYNEL